METLDTHNLPGPIGIFTDRYIRTHWSEFSEYLDSLYPKEYSLREKLWLHSNSQTERPRCPGCGAELRFVSISKGYQEYCCMKCRCNSPEYITKKSGPRKNKDTVQEKIRKTNLERYGVENVFQSKEIRNKIKETFSERYGVTHPSQIPEVKQKIQDTYKKHCEEDPSFREVINKKIKETYKRRLKYDPEFINNKNKKISKGISKTYSKHCIIDSTYAETKNKKISESIKKRFNYTKETNPEIIKERYKKSYNTKKQNHGFNASKIEEQFAGWLTDNNIKFIRQYRSEQYPFACDFYFPDKDLYFEINANWTHGGHPFDCNNPDDIATTEIWKSKKSKYYDNAIETWVVRDPKKYKTAQKNHLNWAAVYNNNLDDIIKEYDRH